MNEVAHYEGVAAKDKSNSRSIINLVKNTAFEHAVMAVPDELFLLDEKEIQKKARVNVTDDFIKTSFWNEYDLAQAKAKNMTLENVYVRCCSRDYFFKQFLSNSYKVAWLLTPPPNYQVMLDTLLSRGLQRLYEILSLPLENTYIDNKGNAHTEIDAKIAHVIYQITKDIDIRVKGAIPQIVASTSRNVNVNLTGEVPQEQMTQTTNMEEVDAELRRLEEKLGPTIRDQMPKERDVIEVEYTAKEPDGSVRETNE